MTPETFVTRFPEYAGAEALIGSALAQADRIVADTWTGDRRDDVVGLAAARILALSPFGRDARLSSANGATVYDARLRPLFDVHAVGRFRTV